MIRGLFERVVFMRTLKRILAALMVVLSVFSVTAFAEEDFDITLPAYAEARRIKYVTVPEIRQVAAIIL